MSLSILTSVLQVHTCTCTQCNIFQRACPKRHLQNQYLTCARYKTLPRSPHHHSLSLSHQTCANKRSKLLTYCTHILSPPLNSLTTHPPLLSNPTCSKYHTYHLGRLLALSSPSLSAIINHFDGFSHESNLKMSSPSMSAILSHCGFSHESNLKMKFMLEFTFLLTES